MSSDYGNGGNPVGGNDPSQGQGNPPSNYPAQNYPPPGNYPPPPYQPAGSYSPQGYQPQGNYPPPPYQPPGNYPPPYQAQGSYPPPAYPPQPQDDYARYPQQGYGAPPPPPVRKGRGPLPFIIAVLVIALLAVGGFFLWQNVAKPLLAGVAYDKLLPNTTMGYFSYNASPSQGQQANWAKIRDAFTSQPGVQDKLNQIGSQMGMAPGMINSYMQSCGQALGSGSGGSIIGNLGGFLSGNVTLAYLQPSDAEVRKVVKDAMSSSGMGSLGGIMTTKPGSKPLSPPPAAGSQQVGCEALALFENHLVAVVELDVNSLDKNSIIAKLQAKTNDQNKGSLTKDETYNGSDIYKINLDSTASTFYGLLIGKEAVLSSNKDSLKAVVDAYKDSSKSLSSNALYNAALAKLPADRSMTIYLDGAKFAGTASAAIDEMAKDSPMMGSSFDSTKSMYDQLKSQNNVAVISVAAQPNGVQVDIAGNTTDLNAAFATAAPLMSDRNLVKLMPADVWAFAASANLKDLVTQGLIYLDKINYFSSFGTSNMNSAKIRQQFKDATGLDLDNDILSWMGGEWGLYVQPGADASTPAQGGFVLNVKDNKDKASASIQKINQALKDKKLVNTGDQYGNKLTEQRVAGSTVYKFGNDYSSVYYGIVGDYFFITSNTATMQAIANGKGGVTDSANYKGAMTNALTNNTAIVYVNFQAIREFVEKTMDSGSRANYEQNYKPFLVPFRSLGITADIANGLQHSVIFIGIEK